jgi:Tfp pilus assembly protein PilO
MTAMKGIPGGWRPWHIDAAGAAALALMLIAAYALGIRPVVQSREARASLAAQRDQELQKADSLGIALRELSGRVEEARQSLDAGAITLESAGRLNRRLARLTGLAAANHLKLDAIEPGKTARLPCYDAMEIAIAGRGTFTDCTAFLHHIYADVPDTEVMSVELSGQPGAADNAASFKVVLSWLIAGSASPVQP